MIKISQTPDPGTANRLRETAVHERPQERLERMGAQALGDAELLALLLRSGTQGADVLTLSARLIAEAGSLAALLAWTARDFRRIRGIGRVKALQMVAAFETARRAVGCPASEGPVLNGAISIVGHLNPHVAGLEVEKFFALCLNRKNRLIKRVEITSGTATSTLAHPREVFRAAIRESAAAVVCVHNHPSGDPTPSKADIEITCQLRDAARAVDISFIDHIIVGRRAADPKDRGYFSFREAGLM